MVKYQDQNLTIIIKSQKHNNGEWTNILKPGIYRGRAFNLSKYNENYINLHIIRYCIFIEIKQLLK